jgi:hypothetical protein
VSLACFVDHNYLLIRTHDHCMLWRRRMGSCSYRAMSLPFSQLLYLSLSTAEKIFADIVMIELIRKKTTVLSIDFGQQNDTFWFNDKSLDHCSKKSQPRSKDPRSPAFFMRIRRTTTSPKAATHTRTWKWRKEIVEKKELISTLQEDRKQYCRNDIVVSVSGKKPKKRIVGDSKRNTVNCPTDFTLLATSSEMILIFFVIGFFEYSDHEGKEDSYQQCHGGGL